MVDSRARVLDNIARAAGRRGTAGSPPRTHGTGASDSERIIVDSPTDLDLVLLLSRRLADYGAEVTDLRAAADHRAVVRAGVEEALARHGAQKVVVPDSFPASLRPAGVQVVVDRPEAPLDPYQLDALDAAVTTSAGAIAITGTILLDHTGAQGRRALSLVPDLHVALVAERDIFGEVPAAVRALGPRPLMTWISGPSATSDIELDRVAGVHGPRRLVVVIHRL